MMEFRLYKTIFLENLPHFSSFRQQAQKEFLPMCEETEMNKIAFQCHRLPPWASLNRNFQIF